MDAIDLTATDPGRRALVSGLLALTVAGLARQAAAQQAAEAPAAGSGLYTVEIVIFRGGGGSSGEDLTTAIDNAGADSDSAAASVAGSARLGEILPASKHRLGDVAARLNASGAHKVLAHVAWSQTASAWNSSGGLTAEQLGLNAAGFSGLVQLERGTYLHLGFNLAYTAAGGAHYALAQMRRVKFAERNYFDHPALGIIALVTPGG
jgi:hypothetical protein